MKCAPIHGSAHSIDPMATFNATPRKTLPHHRISMSRRSRVSSATSPNATPAPVNSQLVNDMWSSIQTLFKNAYGEYHLASVKSQERLDRARANNNVDDDLRDGAIRSLKNELDTLESGQALVSQLISMMDTSNTGSRTHSPDSSHSAKSTHNRKRKRIEDAKQSIAKRSRGGNDLSTTLAIPNRPTINVGTQVAFRLRKTKFSEEEWIQCEVTKVLSDVRFEVQDPEPDENNNPGQSYKASIRDIIAIPIHEDLANIPTFSAGNIVLARYPETTTFYRAEVIDGNRRDGKCRLKFEGEEEEGKETDVDRHYVLAAPR